MSDGEVQFDTDQQNYSPINAAYRGSTSAATGYGGYGQSQATGMTGWLIRHHIISNETQGKAILFGIVFLNLILTGFVVYKYILK